MLTMFQLTKKRLVILGLVLMSCWLTTAAIVLSKGPVLSAAEAELVGQWADVNKPEHIVDMRPDRTIRSSDEEVQAGWKAYDGRLIITNKGSGSSLRQLVSFGRPIAEYDFEFNEQSDHLTLREKGTKSEIVFSRVSPRGE